MARPVTATAGTDPRLTRTKDFSVIVARGTGLSPLVIKAWILSEGGPAGNPLNIGPGRDYGSPEKAAAATVKLLHDPRYSQVLTSARTGKVGDQLAAIAKSPWDACHYRGTESDGRTCKKAKDGTFLLAVYETAFGEPGTVVARDPETGATTEVVTAGPTPDDLLGGGPLDGLTGIAGAIAGLPGAVADWLETKAALVLGYIVLTGAAVALFVLGLSRVAGASPSAFLPQPSTSAQGKDIPF